MCVCVRVRMCVWAHACNYLYMYAPCDVYMRADVMIHTSSVLLDDLPCRAFHLYAALHCCGVIAAQICICKYMHI